MSNGQVYWITGLAGSGKSSLAKQFMHHLKSSGRMVILLDGDDLRRVFELPDSYAKNDRLSLGIRYAKLCQLLASQGFDVICATISLIHEVQAWNRLHQNHYTEILLLCDEPIRLQRLAKRNDQHELLSSSMVGHDILPEWPKQPEITLHNNQDSGLGPLLDECLDQLTRSYANA